jgi:thymidylate synthase ThyX
MRRTPKAAPKIKRLLLPATAWLYIIGNSLEHPRRFEDVEVKLVGAIGRPYEVAVASARTCYSGKGVIYPEDVSKDEKSIELRDRIASMTLEAGHLTTRQHAHFVFSLSGVSRQFIWSFLHSHPFYNSEQVSQRYVRVKPGNFVSPQLPEKEAKLYWETLLYQMESYEKLIQILKPSLSEEYYQRFAARKKSPEKWDKAIDKRAFEVARYVLPVATTAYLYHTVSALTLLRYAKLVEMFDTPAEQKIVIGRMLDAVRAIDPLFEKEIQDPMPLDQTIEFQLAQQFQNSKRETRREFVEDFDRGLEGKVSKLVNYSASSETVLAQAVRIAIGKLPTELSDDDALAYVLDPKNNKLVADTLNSGTQDRLSQLLHHVHFTFQKKISHTADSQDQRHRTVLSSRPLLVSHYFGKPDFITPFGVTQVPEALEIYNQVMERTFSTINILLDAGVSSSDAFYLLPNAYPIRMVSSGDLHGLQHKWKMRSCYNAQEEIFRATIDEIAQVRAVLPRIGEHMKAPCYLRLRAGIKPYCPEGDHFCGVPVWKYDISQYQRKSL